jgi:4-hydroxy-2-oxoheptanedioate aldolase
MQAQSREEASTLNVTDMTYYRSTSLVQPHRVREALRDAHQKKINPLIGIFLSICSPTTALLVAQLGFDVAIIDWEHSSCNIETMTTVRGS